MKRMATVHRKAEEWLAEARQQHTEQIHRAKKKMIDGQDRRLHTHHRSCGCFHWMMIDQYPSLWMTHEKQEERIPELDPKRIFSPFTIAGKFQEGDRERAVLCHVYWPVARARKNKTLDAHKKIRWVGQEQEMAIWGQMPIKGWLHFSVGFRLDSSAKELPSTGDGQKGFNKGLVHFPRCDLQVRVGRWEIMHGFRAWVWHWVVDD